MTSWFQHKQFVKKNIYYFRYRENTVKDIMIIVARTILPTKNKSFKLWEHWHFSELKKRGDDMVV
jgi:hypothetical protein